MSHLVRRRIAKTVFTGGNEFLSGKSSNSDASRMANKQHGEEFSTQYSTSFTSIFSSSFKPFHRSSSQISPRSDKKNEIPTLPSLYQKNVRNIDFGFKSITSRTAFARKLYFGVLVQLAVIGGLQYLPYIACPSLPYG